MLEERGEATLIFYKIGPNVWKEPFLNRLAAWAQNSDFTHVELAIGNEHNARGEMCNVVRIFNDDVGVELASRTGMNPQYSYLSLGCTKAAERAMLAYARSLVGMPFSATGMALALFWPRVTTGSSFYCAELVAAVLQRGGLLSPHSNPGAATPENLHRLYKPLAAVHANPFMLRKLSAASGSSSNASASVGKESLLTIVAPKRSESAPPRTRQMRTVPTRSLITVRK